MPRKLPQGMSKEAQANFIKMVESGHRGLFSLKTGKPVKQTKALAAINAEVAKLQFKPC
jgi:hypothetical protein